MLGHWPFLWVYAQSTFIMGWSMVCTHALFLALWDDACLLGGNFSLAWFFQGMGASYFLPYLFFGCIAIPVAIYALSS